MSDYLHSYGHSDPIRGFNYTTPEHRSFLVYALRTMQEMEAPSRGRWGAPFIAPGIVDYCTAVLAPYVESYKRSRRTWEGLRAFEDGEARPLRPYVEGMGVETFRKRMTRAWNAA